MTRRVCMWVSVASLVGLGLVSAATSLAFLSHGDGGWTFYTPYPQPSQSLAMRLVEVGSYVQLVLFPLAALSSAGYILLLDRDVRRGEVSRGFEVQAARPGDGA